MSGRELLEGMSYVDERFVDEAEHQTIQKGSTRPWIMLLPFAACLCILLACFFSTWDMTPFSAKSTDTAARDQESIQQYERNDDGEAPAAGDPQSWLYDTQYIRTNGGDESSRYPSYAIIRSRAELDQYYEDNKMIFDMKRREQVYSDTTVGFLDAIEKYDEAFFIDRDLVILVLEEGSGSIRHEVNGIRPYYDGSWLLTVRRITPEVCTDDMAQWHLMLEIEKDLIGEDEEIVLDMTE